jgi:hypothetical protein
VCHSKNHGIEIQEVLTPVPTSINSKKKIMAEMAERTRKRRSKIDEAFDKLNKYKDVINVEGFGEITVENAKHQMDYWVRLASGKLRKGMDPPSEETKSKCFDYIVRTKRELEKYEKARRTA